MVILLWGHLKPELMRAARTLSLDSLTAVSGKPTRHMLGKPPERCTSTVIGGACTPEQPRLCTSANPISTLTRPCSGPLPIQLVAVCYALRNLALAGFWNVCRQLTLYFARFVGLRCPRKIKSRNSWSQIAQLTSGACGTELVAIKSYANRREVPP